MNILYINTLKSLRKLYGKAFNVLPLPKPSCEQDPNVVSSIIYNKLTDSEPCMIARLGSTELSAITNYLGIIQPTKSVWSYINGEGLPWWWNESIMRQMQQWSGFFPPSEEMMERFCKMMLEDLKEVDVLGSWLGEERYVDRELSNARKIRLIFIDPFWSTNPWTRALKGKRVLVIHPFAKIIESQYIHSREGLFDNPDILPEFELLTICAVQSLGGVREGYGDWFEALDSMKRQIDKVEFDICLLGCGAYGLPLAAYIKWKGKKALHWGGALQLLFGIRGKRWESKNYASSLGLQYPALMNKYWVRPDDIGRPANFNQVEDACYW